LHVATNDHSRYAYVEVLTDEKGATCASFVLRAASHFAMLGIRIERLMTDRAKNYVQSQDFAQALLAIGAAHKITQPYRPQTNGKAERFNRTMLDEWAYARLYRTNEARLRTLPHGSRPTIATVPTPRWEGSRRFRGPQQRKWELQLARGEADCHAYSRSASRRSAAEARRACSSGRGGLRTSWNSSRPRINALPFATWHGVEPGGEIMGGSPILRGN
jgi:transposase InsO family protein